MTTSREISKLLEGFASANPADLAKLAERDDWKDLARWEQTRRAARLLELFDDHMLAAIASGEIDIRRLCGEAVALHKVSR